MRRDLFVFAGQSNMMGASVYPPKKGISVIAERAVENLYRVLTEGKQPSLEAELVRGLVEDKE
jgi:hypothetical protein